MPVSEPDVPNVLAGRYASAPMRATLVAVGPRSSSSDGCGWRCSGPSATSASTCPTASSRPTRPWSTRSTWLASRQRERVTRHDVKARIEEFCALAGHEHVHKGMTSRDLTENVEQLQVRDAAGARARPDGGRPGPAGRRWPPSTPTLAMVGRSHNVAAQATTLGKRFANAGRGAAARARAARATCSPATRCGASRGRWAPPRTSSTCSAATQAKLDALEAGGRRATSGSTRVLGSVGQVYPRSLDLDVVARAGAGGGRPVEPGHHDPADGRPRAGVRGVRRRPGGLVGHAAQDEHTQSASGSTGWPSSCGATCRWCPSWPATSGTRAT